MSEPETTAVAAEAAKIEKLTKATRSAKPEVPANVIVTELSNGTTILNAVAA